MEYVALAVICYLLGSIPTGLIVGKVAKGIDVRTYGSGKIGATNILRTLGPGAFVTVFAADFAKGFLAVLLASYLIGNSWAQVVAGLAALVGHNWSVFLGFSGGRGIAVGIGGLYRVSPFVAAPLTVVTIVVILLSRYVSLGNVIGGIIAIPTMLLAVLLGLERPEYLFYVAPGAAIVLYQHRDNIMRLLSGTERRLGESALPYDSSERNSA